MFRRQHCQHDVDVRELANGLGGLDLTGVDGARLLFHRWDWLGGCCRLDGYDRLDRYDRLGWGRRWDRLSPGGHSPTDNLLKRSGQRIEARFGGRCGHGGAHGGGTHGCKAQRAPGSIDPQDGVALNASRRSRHALDVGRTERILDGPRYENLVWRINLGCEPVEKGTMSAVVEARSLTVAFGQVVAVDGFDLSVQAGASLALVGRNGAGKSTTLKVLAGVLPPTTGSVRVAGIDVVASPAQARARVGYCPDVGGLIPRATPWEHLQLAARLRGLPAGWETRAADLLDRFDLASEADRVTAGFSHGMGRRMSVLLAAFHEPDVLLLDEPFDGVDPLGVEATLDVIREFRVGGSAVLVSTHLLELAVQACAEAVVLRRGKVVAAAPSIELSGESGAARYRSLLT